MSQPREWRRYTTWLKAEGQVIDAGLARFAARYRVAFTLTSLEFNGLGPAAAAGYTAALRAALAYSALEAFDQALFGRAGATRIQSTQVAHAFASHRAARLQGLLASELTKKKLKERLTELAEGKAGDDVTALAEGVRHLVFHGDFTAYGAGAAQSRSVRTLLDDLAVATLLAADDAFHQHLDQECAIGRLPNPLA